MILAAGRGERMRPLTDTTPKPLLRVRGEPLIAHHIKALKRAGIENIVINISYLQEKILDYLGDGSDFGVTLAFSQEPRALETGGGICTALTLLGDAPFWVVNGDVLTTFKFFQPSAAFLSPETEAHLILVDNPPQNPQGDFSLSKRGYLAMASKPSYTYSGIGIFRPCFFHGYRPMQRFPLAPLLREKLSAQLIKAEHFRGEWIDVGTPERLQYAQSCSWID